MFQAVLAGDILPFFVRRMLNLPVILVAITVVLMVIVPMSLVILIIGVPMARVGIAIIIVTTVVGHDGSCGRKLINCSVSYAISLLVPFSSLVVCLMGACGSALPIESYLKSRPMQSSS